MIELNRLIDPDFATWYPIPEALEGPLSAAGGAPSSWAEFVGAGVSPKALQRALARAILAADTGLPYHNRLHAATVLARGDAALGALSRASLRREGIGLPTTLLEPVLIGLAAHDAEHPGAPSFDLAPAHRVPVGSEGLTPEQWSATIADELAAEAGMSPHQRALAVYTVWSSTKGIAPAGILGLLVRLVDVQLAFELAPLLAEDAAAAMGERLDTPRPRTRAGRRERAVAFQKEVVGPRHVALDHASGVALSGQTRIGGLISTEALLDRTDPVALAIEAAELVAYRRLLDDPLLHDLARHRFSVTSAPAILVIDTGELGASRRELGVVLGAAEAQGADLVSAGGGRIVLSARPPRALACALAVRQATGPALRIGVSAGRVTFDGTDCFGPPVVEATRLVVAAGPAEILATGSLHRAYGAPLGSAVAELTVPGDADQAPIDARRIVAPR